MVKTQKNKKQNNNRTKLIIVCLVLAFGVGAIIYGVVRYLNLDLEYKRAIIACDDKDYSSYVKYSATVTPGNEKINSQLQLLEDALKVAADTNDAEAFSQLWEQYNNLLALQAGTSTESGYYDYSAVEEAKNKCYSLAEDEKEANKRNSVIFMVVGGIATVAVVIVLAAYLNGNNKVRKHSGA